MTGRLMRIDDSIRRRVNNAFDTLNTTSTIMGKLPIGIVASYVALFSTWALADDTSLINEMDMDTF